jgi:poly-beta-hydroxyalkanoate depolymerase
MMYYAYDWHQSMLAPWRALAANGLSLIGEIEDVQPGSAWAHVEAACHLLAETKVTHERPPFDIDGAIEDVADSTPFCTLLRFRRPDAPPLPRVLVSAPLSGHFATLLQATVRTLVRDHPGLSGRFRLRRLCRASDPLSAGDRTGRPFAGGVPALRARAGRRRRDGRKRR